MSTFCVGGSKDETVNLVHPYMHVYTGITAVVVMSLCRYNDDDDISSKAAPSHDIATCISTLSHLRPTKKARPVKVVSHNLQN